MSSKAAPGETRSLERLRAHFEIERELADRLRNAAPAERITLQSEIYDELFRRVPDHPQLTKQRNAHQRTAAVDAQIRLFSRFLHPSSVFLEFGAGDCALPVRLAPSVALAIGVDVSREVAAPRGAPPNFQLVLSDGRTVPLPSGSIDFEYSFQLIEHIHAGDVFFHLQEALRLLKPAGRYFCVTPSRLTGPHDISRYFSRRAIGLHLVEYGYRDLARLFRQAGFRGVSCFCPLAGRLIPVPFFLLSLLELMLESLPYPLAIRLARTRLIEKLLGVWIIGRK